MCMTTQVRLRFRIRGTKRLIALPMESFHLVWLRATMAAQQHPKSHPKGYTLWLQVRIVPECIGRTWQHDVVEVGRRDFTETSIKHLLEILGAIGHKGKWGYAGPGPVKATGSDCGGRTRCRGVEGKKGSHQVAGSGLEMSLMLPHHPEMFQR